MTRLVCWLRDFSITRRLVAVLVLFAASMAAVAVYLGQLTDQKLTDLASLHTLLEQKREIVALETAVGAYAAQLEARESVIASRDFRGLQAVKAAIASSEAAVARHVRRLHALSGEIDPAAIGDRLEALRAAHDEYLGRVVAGDVVAAALAQSAVGQRRGELEAAIPRDDEPGVAGFDLILGDLAKLSDDFSLASGLTITLMVVAILVFSVLLFFSVSRPLERLFVAIDGLDESRGNAFPPDRGPREFQAIGRALEALGERLAAQRAAEEQLRDSEARLRQFAECSADVFWETDDDLRFVWLHAQDEREAVRPTEALGLTRWEAAEAAPDDDPLRRRHRDALRTREPFRDYEYPVDTPEGRRWWRASGAPMFDRQGDFLGYRGTATDVTERKAVAEQLRQSQGRESIGRLSGGVAHDFNNLLSVLKSNLELLQKHAELPGPLVEMLARCARATERGSRLTARLLALGQRQALHPQAVSVAPFLEEFAELVRRTIPSTISVEVSASGNLPAAFADPSALQDALLNLVINARDAMPDGGRLGIAAEVLAAAHVGADDPHGARRVRITVSDTGSGIPEAIRGKVFDPFFTTKAVGEGSGLGLGMVRGFVEQTGGTIGLRSEPGEGTQITIELPTARDGVGVGAEAEIRTVRPVSGQGETVLLVEDDEDVRVSVEAMLMYLGYRVVACPTGREALDVLEAAERPVSVVVSDIVMPGELQGDDFAALLAERYPRLPVVLMTGYALEGVRPDVVRAGVPVLSKPVDADSLNGAIRAALGEHDAASER